jgi:hypothetical protein
LKGAEDRFSDEVLAYLSKELVASQWSSRVTVEAKVKILKDFTFGRFGGQWRLIAGVQQQDIVFYREKDSVSYGDFKSEAMDDITKYRGKPIRVPFVVVELKVGGGNMNTHEFITYSSISAQLKQVFPHCRYCLLMKGNKRGFRQQTFLRHCKGFDRVFVGWESERGRLWAYVEHHLRYLAETAVIDQA